MLFIQWYALIRIYCAFTQQWLLARPAHPHPSLKVARIETRQSFEVALYLLIKHNNLDIPDWPNHISIL